MAFKQSRILASRYNIVTIPASRHSRKLIAGTIAKKKLVKMQKSAKTAKATSYQTYIDKYMAKDEIALTMRIITVKKETNDAPPFLHVVDSRHKYYKDYPGHIQRCYSMSDHLFDEYDGQERQDNDRYFAANMTPFGVMTPFRYSQMYLVASRCQSEF